MKKRVAVIMAVILCFCAFALAGCSTAAAKAPYEVNVDEVFTCTTYNGEVLVVNVDITNTSKDYVDASMVIYSITAKLDGASMNVSYLSTDSANYIKSDEKIAAGETAKAQAVFELNGEAEEGELTLLGVTYAEDSDKQIEFLNETIDFSKVERKVAESSYELTIDNVTKSDDGDGNDIIIVDMTFTNNSDGATSFGYAVDLEIFQNGTALKAGYLPYNHPSYDAQMEGNTYLDIKGGVSIQLRKVYNLNDANTPIEVKATEAMSYDTDPLLEKEIQIK